MKSFEPREQVIEAGFEAIEVSVHLWLDGERYLLAYDLSQIPQQFDCFHRR
jgi:hypothetical protein